MKYLILLQILFATLKFCASQDEPPTTIIISDTRTEMTIEKSRHQNRSSSEKFDIAKESENDRNDLDFDYDDGEDFLQTDIKTSERNEQELQEVLLKAMKNPEIKKQIGEVIPILRVMSPAQRLTLAALVSSQIMSQNTLSEDNLTEMAAMFAGKNIESQNEKHNITEVLLLPISMDIAKMFKGLGREMGRNLREDFFTSHRPIQKENKYKRLTRRPEYKRPNTINRRMDEADYVSSQEEIDVPVAEALKQPGKDECDFFTKNLCLEVPNYPTEAIISSLRKNQEIVQTFLTDFEVPLQDKKPLGGNKMQGNGPRRLERRQDGQNDLKEFVTDGGYMCPSSVKYAKPKRARTTSGVWKYIVNAGDYTQTLRLEICQKPKLPCSFVTSHLSSECAQVYNYHRLLTWDGVKGLHMDVFKVPSCCSCHVQGYSTFYPPDKEFTFAEERKEPQASDHKQGLSEHPYANAGNKREITKTTSVEPPAPVTVRNRQQNVLIKEEYMINPVDHLVPPGPPLPLENENVFNPNYKFKYNQKKSTAEPIRRYPLQQIRTPNKGAEVNEPQEPNFIPKTRPRAPDRPNFNIVQAHRPLVTPTPHQEITESNNPTHFQRNPINPLSYPGLEHPVGNRLFMTPNPLRDLPSQPKPKINSKPPPQYFKPEFHDSKSLPSKIATVYVTPPKIESRISTTSPPILKSELVTSSGPKKINYNYHPIIDFFLTDSKKKQSIFSAPLTSQEWTPVLGH